MGRTILPFRPQLDREIESWSNYRRGMNVNERIFFDEVMNSARKLADAGSLAARPLISEVLFMSILIDQQRQISELSKEIEKAMEKFNDA